MKKKKIFYINQYFRKPTEPGITRSYWIAQKLIEEGYEVTMLAHRNTLLEHVQGIVPRFEIVDVDGIRVIYLRNQYSNEMGICARAWAFLSFMFRSIWWTLKEMNVDLVIATSTPLTVAAPALFRKWFRKTPFIFEVRDLWPDVPIQMGAIKNNILISLLKKLEIITYHNAEHVVALSPGMQDGVVQHIQKERTSMIPNMAKMDQFWPRAKDEQLMVDLGFKQESFKLIHFGAMGRVNGLDYVIDAARIIKNENIQDIEILLIGHGANKARFEKMKEEEGLTCLHVMARKPMREISEIVNFCDASYIGLSPDYPILKHNSSNKFFDSLSAGKPIIVNYDGWMLDILREHNAGISVDPYNPEILVESLIKLKEDDELAYRMGENARALAETVYDKSILCGEFVQVVNRVIADKAQS